MDDRNPVIDTTPNRSRNRGGGEPDRELLDEAIDTIRRHCEPIRIVLFGSGARGELRDDSDIDLLVVVVDEATRRERKGMAFDIREDIGYNPRADVALRTEAEIAQASTTLAGVLRTIAEEGVTIQPRRSRRSSA